MAAGGAVAVAGGAAASSMVPAVGMALASPTIVLLPFAVVGGAWEMAKMKRGKKESDQDRDGWLPPGARA